MTEIEKLAEKLCLAFEAYRPEKYAVRFMPDFREMIFDGFFDMDKIAAHVLGEQEPK